MNPATSQEPIPKYIRAGGEWVQNKGNSWIVLGRDRPGSRSSGYGGQGHTQASSIDLCVGRGSPVPSSSDNLDPNFGADAARIYISQKANIDQINQEYQWIIDNNSKKIFLSSKGDLDPNKSTARIGFISCAKSKSVVKECLTSNGVSLISLRLKTKGHTCHMYPVYSGIKDSKLVASAVRL